jgi:hypothetical protein
MGAARRLFDDPAPSEIGLEFAALPLLFIRVKPALDRFP